MRVTKNRSIRLRVTQAEHEKVTKDSKPHTISDYLLAKAGVRKLPRRK